MRITAIELYHVSIPLKHTFWPTWIPGYPQTHNRFTLIKIITNEGIEGYAAGSAMGTEREGLGDLLGGYLIGTDPTDIDRIQSLLKQAGYLGWRNFWIEPACWDILGKANNKPVYELLGGKARPIQVYCSSGEMHDPHKRVDEFLAMHQRGFKAAKLRVKNKELKDDIRHIEIVSKGLDGKMVLGVDANQGWLVTVVDKIPAWDLERAKEFVRACEANGIEWLEEPLDSRDFDGNAALKKFAKSVKISGAELNYGWDEIKIMMEKDCFHVYQPDATFAGGIQQVKKVIDACHANNREYTPHTWTNGIGFYVNWNMVLADPDNMLPLEYPLEEPSWIPEFREGIIDPIMHKNGMLEPFTRPGLGFKINNKQLHKYGQRFFRMTETGLKIKVIREKGLRSALELKKKKG